MPDPDPAPLRAARPRIYFVRHGQTDWNAAGRLLSFTDEPINGAGVSQARDLARDLREIRFDAAFVSPRIRARQTAQILLDHQLDAPLPAIDERLVEMDFGPYEGWTEARLAADPVAVTRRRDGADLPGVETEASVADRARALFADLSAQPGNTLVVGHGRMLRILLAVCVLEGPPALARSMRMRNCSPAIVEPGDRPLLLGLNTRSIRNDPA